MFKEKRNECDPHGHLSIDLELIPTLLIFSISLLCFASESAWEGILNMSIRKKYCLEYYIFRAIFLLISVALGGLKTV